MKQISEGEKLDSLKSELVSMAVEFTEDGSVALSKGNRIPVGFSFRAFRHDYEELIRSFLQKTDNRKAGLVIDKEEVRLTCWGSVMVKCRRKIEETCWR